MVRPILHGKPRPVHFAETSGPSYTLCRRRLNRVIHTSDVGRVTCPRCMLKHFDRPVKICRMVNHHGERCGLAAISLYGWPPYYCSIAHAAMAAILGLTNVREQRRRS